MESDGFGMHLGVDKGTGIDPVWITSGESQKWIERGVTALGLGQWLKWARQTSISLGLCFEPLAGFGPIDRSRQTNQARRL